MGLEIVIPGLVHHVQLALQLQVGLFTSAEKNHWPQQKGGGKSRLAVRVCVVLLSCASSAAFDCLHLFYCT